ncbi:hypothetical protein CYPRO_2549 [Cyclonatronum proteinivorum]|uniref:Uncharacterized protein n=1 Tax=Cyclonatronum proteinivorum TaxID=1457365 RepID=A0A345UMT9_9BACT|nr:hypothetical protein [Cyclonatronum proteinivorum]AXJ01791.1 hypothetical protein CYPRO_2549 [Cyclonatronum proteinivorum]
MNDLTPSGKPKIPQAEGETAQSGRLSLKKLARHAKSVNLFYLISGAAQLFLGALVTMVSILNLVQPIWLAAFLSLFGCVVTMLGVYQVYEVFNSRRSVSDLARDAIERAIQDRN